MAKLRMTWTDSQGDTRQETVPLPDATNPAIYWNTSRIEADVGNMPDPPEWAGFLKVELDLSARTDASAANNRVYLPIQKTQLHSSLSGPLLTGERLDGAQNQLLNSSDAADPKLTVWSYAPASAMGVPVTVLDKQGHFTYDPGPLIDWSYLPPGESLTDTIYFQAAYDGAYGVYSEHSVVLLGTNDVPVAGDDAFSTNDATPLTLQSYDYLGNDYDVDLGDEVVIKSMPNVSARGAAVKMESDGTLVYDPTVSATLAAMKEGELADDTFSYVVTDNYGATAAATVHVQVAGFNSPPRIQAIHHQFTIADLPFEPIPVALADPDSDVMSLQVSAYADDTSIVADSVVTGAADSWQILLTPAPGITGQTFINVIVSDAEGATGSYRFPVTVGSAIDLDLDGVGDREELAGPHQGDMNQDGITDDRQPNVATLPTATGNGYLSVVVSEDAQLSQVSAANPANGQMPFGSVQYEIKPADGGAEIKSWLYVQSPTSTANVAYRMVEPSTGGVQWERWMYNSQHGAILRADHFELVVSDGGVGDVDGAIDGKAVLSVAFGHAANPWQNAVPEDVDNDSFVTALDALILINAINRGEGRRLGQELVGDDEIPYFLDPSGDLSLDPIDALVVINWLNNKSAGEGIAAGEGSVSSRNELWSQWENPLEVESARRKKRALTEIERAPWTTW